MQLCFVRIWSINMPDTASTLPTTVEKPSIDDQDDLLDEMK